MSTLKIFDKSNIETCPWPKDEQGEYAKNFLSPLIQEGTSKFISNVDADILVAIINSKALPIILGNRANCYVCSPFDQYITYGKFELQELKNPIAETLAGILLTILGWFLKLTQFNRIITVNNWLLSTNLYPVLDKDEIELINQELVNRYPKHLILYRSLNEYTNKLLMQKFESLGGKKIMSRQVYITDPHNPSYKKRSDFKKDQGFLRRTELSLNTPQHSDIEQIKKCYDDLYINKYSDLNPQFTFEFFANAIKHELFTFKGFYEEDKLLSILGYFKRNGVMTTPIFGFDQSKPVSMGLYRLISSQLMLDSEERSLVLNQSSGASHFKSQRGAQPYIEYNYFFNQHCSGLQKLGWGLMSLILNRIVVKLMQRLKL